MIIFLLILSVLVSFWFRCFKRENIYWYIFFAITRRTIILNKVNINKTKKTLSWNCIFRRSCKKRRIFSTFWKIRHFVDSPWCVKYSDNYPRRLVYDHRKSLSRKYQVRISELFVVYKKDCYLWISFSAKYIPQILKRLEKIDWTRNVLYCKIITLEIIIHCMHYIILTLHLFEMNAKW